MSESACSRFGSVSYPHGDGLTIPERQTVLSLWPLTSSPLILGVNPTQLCRPDLKLLENRAAAGPLAGNGDKVKAARDVRHVPGGHLPEDPRVRHTGPAGI
jgi:hypothetical protein